MLTFLGEGETLLTLHNVGKGIASGAEEQEAAQGGGADSAGADGASGDVGPGAEGTTATTSPERKRLSMNDGEAVEGGGWVRVQNMTRSKT